jgi:hypothetical protein
MYTLSPRPLPTLLHKPLLTPLATPLPTLLPGAAEHTKLELP